MIEPVSKQVPTAGRSAAARWIGTVYDDAPTLYVFEDVLAEMLDYAEADRTREQGGFLLGGLHEHRGPYVEVRGFLPAARADSSATSVTFTHETWADMTRRVDEYFPDERVVGWMHTHPRLGVFLSSYDLFIHRHFFSQPWQIALVIDPCSEELGFFQWRRGEITGCGFVCVRRDTR